MKKFLCTLLLGLVLTTQYTLAVEYTEEQKNFLYDVFLEHYTKGMHENIDKLNLDANAKEEIKVQFNESINREELINSTWPCLQNADPSSKEDVTNCFRIWGNKQQIQTFELIKPYYM